MEYTVRARGLFMSTDTKFPREVIWAMGLVKYAAARVNTELGLLKPEVGSAVMNVARRLMNGEYDGEITVDVHQTGSGTGLNMNVNEVISRHVNTEYGINAHPNDHVNLGQSSNDVVPSAIRVSAVKSYLDSLRPALLNMIRVMEEKGGEFNNVVKAGRTHLRDALPITLGQEFSAYIDAFKHDLSLLDSVIDYVKELPIGGTAVGTGINTHPDFGNRVVKVINEETNLGFRRANPFRAMRLLTDLLTLSSILRSLSMDLYRLCQDIRLMFSGPFTGLNEVDIPTQGEVAGSSIMPGKVNPVTVESALQAVSTVIGLDEANMMAAMLGEFELSMGIPLMGYNVVRQVRILTETMDKLSSLVIREMRPNVERMRHYAESTSALITLISPIIGYEKASELAKQLKEGHSIRDILLKLGYTEGEVNRILNLEELTKPGIKLRGINK
ncbi:class II fumarate hydratase [Caldivirga sp.]|uniref:class II fumarate hydratase n=1 Tax=Caldivirga sp. TaxID=2080243 RepID=UPI003D0C2EAA